MMQSTSAVMVAISRSQSAQRKAGVFFFCWGVVGAGVGRGVWVWVLGIVGGRGGMVRGRRWGVLFFVGGGVRGGGVFFFHASSLRFPRPQFPFFFYYFFLCFFSFFIFFFVF